MSELSVGQGREGFRRAADRRQRSQTRAQSAQHESVVGKPDRAPESVTDLANPQAAAAGESKAVQRGAVVLPRHERHLSTVGREDQEVSADALRAGHRRRVERVERTRVETVDLAVAGAVDHGTAVGRHAEGSGYPVAGGSVDDEALHVGGGERRIRLEGPACGGRDDRGGDDAAREPRARRSRRCGRFDCVRLAGVRLCHPAQLPLHVSHGLPAIVGVLGETRRDQPAQRGRRQRLCFVDGRRLILDDGADDARPSLAFEGPASGNDLVERGAEGEDVGAGVGRLAVELLRRHVLQRAQDGSRAGQRRRAGRGLAAAGFRLARAELRQAEVEQLHAVGREHHVPRLQIAVDDPLPVRRVERVRDGDAGRQRLVEREGAALETPGQRLAPEQLHDQVVGTVLAADVVQRADVRMTQRGHRPRLALEALPRLGIGGDLPRQDLDGHRAIEAGIGGAVDLAHAAGPEGCVDPVGAERLTGVEGHRIREPPRSSPGRCRAPESTSPC